MNAIDALKQRARDWAAKVVELANMEVPSHLEGEKSGLLKFAKTVKNSIEKVFPSFSEVAEIDELQELGFVPIVAGAAVAVAAAAIAKWTYDYNKFKTKVAEYNRLVGIGMGPGEAAKVIDSLDPQKGFFNFSAKSLLPLVLVGGGAVYLLGRK